MPLDEEPGDSPNLKSRDAKPTSSTKPGSVAIGGQPVRGAPQARSSATSLATAESTSLAPEPEPEVPKDDSPVMTWDVRPVSTKPKRRKRRYRFKLTSNMYSGPVLSAVNSGDKSYLTT